MDLPFLQDDAEEEVDITPMIDCVFLLLIFFMVTSTFIEEAKAYRIELPKAANPETISLDNTYILAVTLEGGIYLTAGGPEQKVPDMEEAARLLAAAPRKSDGTMPPVVLRCDARCEYAQYVQAKNALKLAGASLIFEEVEVGK